MDKLLNRLKNMWKMYQDAINHKIRKEMGRDPRW